MQLYIWDLCLFRPKRMRGVLETCTYSFACYYYYYRDRDGGASSVADSRYKHYVLCMHHLETLKIEAMNLLASSLSGSSSSQAASRSSSSPRLREWSTRGGPRCGSCRTATRGPRRGGTNVCAGTAHCIDNGGQESRRRQEASTISTILGPDSGQELEQVRRHQTLHLQQHCHDTVGKHETDEDHAVGRQLGRDSDKVEVGLHAPLVLGGGVAHGDDKCR